MVFVTDLGPGPVPGNRALDDVRLEGITMCCLWGLRVKMMWLDVWVRA